MNKNETPISQTIPCTECSAGVMHPRLLTYFTWLGDELITVPNFPAWVCDMCGRREYDEKAISQLTMLLNPNAGKPTKAKKASPPSRPQPGHSRPAPES
ncbi:MAG TPA: YgiT-type zinc finger protein [Anaerolineales bacterium]|nr:YgiT-type zinc finger protein [Anaerolineales bacterium]